MALKNPWIGYVTRSYEQIKSSVLTRFQSLIPEIRDHSDNNVFVKMISIWSGIAEMIGYYIDNVARDRFLKTTRLFENAIYLADQVNYRIKGASPASVEVTFYINAPAPSDILIPGGTEVRTITDLAFFTLEDATIPTGQKEVRTNIKQQVIEEDLSLGLSSGAKDQIFVLGNNVVDNTIYVTVGGVSYLFIDTFALAGRESEVFTTSVNKEGEVYILFGDGVNGKMPPFDSEVLATYYTTSGSDGNIPENSIVNIVPTVTVPSGITLAVRNFNRTSGGRGVEALSDLQKNIPISLNTNNRAVTDFDYDNLARLVPGVAKSLASDLKGKVVDIFIAPQGGGVASPALRADVAAYMNTKRMNTTRIVVKSAGEVRLKMELSIKVFSNFSNFITLTAVKNALSDFYSVENQEIKGEVELSDIYQVVEQVEGVKSSKVLRITPSPYANPQGNAPALNWDRELQEASISVKRWLVKMISGTQFQLYRENVFLGTYDVGVEYILDELKFTVNAGTYAISEQWVFYTYPYSDSFVLQDFSIPITFPEDIIVYAEGGL